MTRRPALLLSAALLAAACSHAPKAPPSAQATLQAALDQARQAVRADIHPAGRAAQADAILAQLDALLLESIRAKQAEGQRLVALDRRQDATEAEFRALFAATDARRLDEERRGLALRGQLAALLTDEEWKRTTEARQHLLELDLGPGAEPL